MSWSAACPRRFGHGPKAGYLRRTIRGLRKKLKIRLNFDFHCNCAKHKLQTSSFSSLDVVCWTISSFVQIYSCSYLHTHQLLTVSITSLHDTWFKNQKNLNQNWFKITQNLQRFSTFVRKYLNGSASGLQVSYEEKNLKIENQNPKTK